MTLQIQSPYIHVEDSNGNPHVGATLAVYQAGTTTYADIYSDDGLSSALPNPLSGIYASDAAGNFPRVYIAAGTYKLRAETSAGVLIFQEDNIDTGLSAGTGALPISRGGTGATTAAGARSNLDVPSNSELTSLATQITTLEAALQGIVSAPQGRLTLTSGAGRPTSDVTSATAVYYTPYVGALAPIYDGSQFSSKSFTEQTLTLNSNHLANTIYDVFAIYTSGSVVIATGPAWNNSSAGTGSRGTGGGTTELEAVNGILVNKNALASARNGSTLYSVSARQATYLGSILIDGSAGQITCHVAYGQSRKWSVWNAYNRLPIYLKAGDSTASWTYSSSTIRAANNAAANSLTIFSGLADEHFDLQYAASAVPNSTAPTSLIGYNSTSAGSGYAGRGADTALTTVPEAIPPARYLAPPAIGIQTITALEATNDGGGNTATYNGTEVRMLLSAVWRG